MRQGRELETHFPVEIMDVGDFQGRLKDLQGDASARSFAQSIGVGEGTFRALLKGGKPTLDTLVAIAEATGVEIAWLATGKGQKWPATAAEAQSEALEATFATIPRLAVEVSAGNGALAHHEEPGDTLAFRADWLRRMGINPRAARALTVRGDSMEPTIRDGDILLVDTSIDYVRDNALYVVVLGGLVLVKRVHVKRDGSLTLISDNTTFPPEDVPANETGDLSIAGRVMWFGRSI